MAKETAHQLGTPISSLMGWVEYLKNSPDRTIEVIADLEKDLNRLQTVTNRFSKIGSVPDLQEEKLDNIIDEVIEYFRRRLPANNEKIEIKKYVNPQVPHLLLNKALFSWVLENLIKKLTRCPGRQYRFD